MSRRLFVAVCVALAACKSKPEPVPAPATPAKRAQVSPAASASLRAIAVNQTVLHYRMSGDHGSWVVFVHGSLGDLDEWRPQLDLFSRDHRVIVYSRRHHPPNLTDVARPT
jgi:pimeloyl-ACP methyl ester carboxylesterase